MFEVLEALRRIGITTNIGEGGRSAGVLTDRQMACLQGVAQHKTAKEIAVELGISNHAVEKHLKVVRQKLGAETTLEALRIYQRGMVEPYYAPSDLSINSSVLQSDRQGRLNDVAFANFEHRPRRIWEYELELTPKQVLLAIVLVTVGLVATVALLVAAAQGFNSVLADS